MTIDRKINLRAEMWHYLWIDSGEYRNKNGQTCFEASIEKIKEREIEEKKDKDIYLFFEL